MICPRGQGRDAVAHDRIDETGILTGSLDWYLTVVQHKVQGLLTDVASNVMTATGLSPLGVVADLAAVEVAWFEETFAGQRVDPVWDDHGSFKLCRDDSVDSILDDYRAACARSRSIVEAAPSLDVLSVQSDEFRGHVSLRSILIHLLEETARHAGHLESRARRSTGRLETETA
jgi:hypothetical protein